MVCAHILVDVVVDALRLRDADLQSVTARQFFRGRTVRTSSRDRTVSAFAQKLLEFVQATHSLNERREWARLVDPISVANRAIDRWDALDAAFGTRSAILDLSIRLAGVALLVLGSCNDVDQYLNQLEGPLLALSNKRKHQTHEELANEIRVTRRQVDRWVAGDQTPTPEHVPSIVRALWAPPHRKSAQREKEEFERRVARWFASRALKRKLRERFGDASEFMQVPKLLRTLLLHNIIHEADQRSQTSRYDEMGTDYAPYCLFAYGIESLSGWMALEVIEAHAHDETWRGAATKILAPQRAHEAEATRNPIRYREPTSQRFAWEAPGLLESIRPLPIYPRALAAYATAALRAKDRRAATRLAKRAAELGQSEPLKQIHQTRRKRIPKVKKTT